MYKPFLHILFYLLPCALRAQENLVPNPSFEDTVYCPLGLSDLLNSSVSWYSPTGGSPDLHHICQTDPSTGLGVPQNAFGWQWPRTGNAYVGFHFSAFEFGSNGREYIQCKLIEPLLPGIRYAVEFYASKGDSSTKACNLAGLFSQNAVTANDNLVLPYVPQVVSPPDQPILETESWVQISDTIVAVGGEQYLTIGLFTDDANTLWVETEGGNVQEPYYYIDDVSVIQIVNAVSFPNVFTPDGDGVNDQLIISYRGFVGGSMSIYDRWGRRIFNISGHILEWDGQINGFNAHSGIYFLLIEMESENGKRSVEKGFVHLLR